jgi:radical SAM protein with 4Fe4S-binding SPASM domain
LNNSHLSLGNTEVIFAKILELVKTIECRTLKVYWQGGEVLGLDPETVGRILEMATAVFHDSGVLLEHHLQTNLLPYDTQKWQALLSQFHLGTISSSLDFPNLYRKTPSLAPKLYNQAWLKKREAAVRDGFTVSVVSLPNPETLRLGAGRFYQYFREEIGIKNLQINFPFPGKGKGLRPLNLQALAEFMSELYAIWVSSGRDLNLSPFRALEGRIWQGTGPPLSCCWSFSCAQSLLAVGPDGMVGQCDCWITYFSNFFFGSLLEHPVGDLLDSPARKAFLDRPLRLLRDSACGECRFWRICHGGCPVRAYAFSGDLFAPDYYCQVYQAMFTAVLSQTDPLPIPGQNHGRDDHVRRAQEN